MAKNTKKTKQQKRLARMMKGLREVEQDYTQFLQELESRYLARMSRRISQDKTESELKMSEVILVFGKPFIEKNARNRDSFDAAVKYSIMIWNLGLLPEENKEDYLKLFQEGIQTAFEGKISREENEAVMETLLYRQKTLFPNIKKMIKSYEIIGSGKNSIVNVASVDLSINHAPDASSE